jgi:hypothetical protein
VARALFHAALTVMRRDLAIFFMLGLAVDRKSVV